MLWPLGTLCHAPVRPLPHPTATPGAGYILSLCSQLLETSWSVLRCCVFLLAWDVSLPTPSSSVMLGMVAISHMWLLQDQVQKSIKLEVHFFGLPSHSFKRPVATRGRWILFEDSALKEHFCHFREFSWAVLLGSYPLRG